MVVYALVSDLMFSSKIGEVVRESGHELKTVRKAEDLPAIISSAPPFILVDLHHNKLDPIAAIEQVKQGAPATKVICFFSHVQVELAERAEASGADEVLPRSAFFRDLAGMLAV